MEIKVRETDYTTAIIMEPRGEIDLYSSPQLRERIRELSDMGYIHLLFNMQDVTYLDSTGLGALIKAVLLVKPKGGTIRLYNIKKHIMELIQLTMLTQLFSLYQTEEEALSGLA